jgi:hypothetical protein
MKLLFKEFFSFFSENFENRERRMNSSDFLYSFLQKYKNEEYLFFSFRDVVKQPVGSEKELVDFNPSIGINPKSKYNTPNGIYGYPFYNMENEVKQGKIPFASNRPIVVVYKPKPGVKVTTPRNFLEPEYNFSIEKLGKMFNLSEEEIESMFLFDIDPDYQNTYLQKIWSLTRFLSNKNPNKWAKLLVDLDLPIILDDSGSGFIHPGEPHQVVAFGRKYLQVLDVSEKYKLETSPTTFLQNNFKNLSKHLRIKDGNVLYNEHAVEFYNHKRKLLYRSTSLNEIPIDSWRETIEIFISFIDAALPSASKEVLLETVSFLLLDFEKNYIISLINKDTNSSLYNYYQLETYLLAHYHKSNFMSEDLETFLRKINKNKSMELFQIFDYSELNNLLTDSIKLKTLDYSKLENQFLQRLFKDSKNLMSFLNSCNRLYSMESFQKEFSIFISTLKDIFTNKEFKNFQKNIFKSILTTNDGSAYYLKIKDENSFLNKSGINLLGIKDQEKQHIINETIKEIINSAKEIAKDLDNIKGKNVSDEEYQNIKDKQKEKRDAIKNLVYTVVENFFQEFKKTKKLDRENLRFFNQNIKSFLSIPVRYDSLQQMEDLYSNTKWNIGYNMENDYFILMDLLNYIFRNLSTLKEDGVSFLEIFILVKGTASFKVNVRERIKNLSMVEMQNLFNFIKNNQQLDRANIFKIILMMMNSRFNNDYSYLSPSSREFEKEVRELYINEYN